MRKRIRKKTHRGEFTEWGRRLVIIRNHKGDFDQFLDAFIDMVEANDCYCGGGGKEDTLDVVVELGRPGEDRETRVMSIAAWLESRQDVESWRFGEEFDLWHGTYKEEL